MRISDWSSDVCSSDLVTISDNIVLGGMYNGISVGNATGLVMTDNVVGAYTDQKSWLRIENSTDVVLTGNSASTFLLKSNSYLSNSGTITTAQPKWPGKEIGLSPGSARACISFFIQVS